jgi:hypothetical protein
MKKGENNQEKPYTLGIVLTVVVAGRKARLRSGPTRSSFSRENSTAARWMIISTILLSHVVSPAILNMSLMLPWVSVIRSRARTRDYKRINNIN